MSSDTPMTDAFSMTSNGRYLYDWFGFCRQLERDLATARQQLAERDALIERMRDALDELYDAADGFCVSGIYFNELYGNQELLSNVAGILESLPPQALAEHDAEVRRKVLEEVVELWDAPYAGETFICKLRSMAAEKREGE